MTITILSTVPHKMQDILPCTKNVFLKHPNYQNTALPCFQIPLNNTIYKTIEKYTQVTTTSLAKIKSPLDHYYDSIKGDINNL